MFNLFVYIFQSLSPYCKLMILISWLLFLSIMFGKLKCFRVYTCPKSSWTWAKHLTRYLMRAPDYLTLAEYDKQSHYNI